MLETILVVFVFYLVSGYVIFCFGVEQFGGKQEYYKYIAHKVKYPRLSYYLGMLVFIFIWPVCFRRGGKDE